MVVAENKRKIGLNTDTAHKYIDFTTHDAVVMSNTDTASTHLVE